MKGFPPDLPIRRGPFQIRHYKDGVAKESQRAGEKTFVKVTERRLSQVYGASTDPQPSKLSVRGFLFRDLF